MTDPETNRPPYLVTRTSLLIKQHAEAVSKLPGWLKAEVAKLMHEEAERIRVKRAKVN